LAEVFPHRAPGSAERKLLLELLQTLESRGTVRLPASKGKRWDRSMAPAVPSSIDLVLEPFARPTTDWRGFPWHPRLDWVAGCRGLSAQQLEFLHRVHVGLVHGDFAEPAPLKYRSLQLTGEEKRLGTWMSTSLFASGRLSLELLGCMPDALPIAWEAVGPASRMLIFENAGPFAVARRVLAAMSGPPFDLVGYGGGRAIVAGIGHLLTIEPRPSSILYVGDLDQAGLDIAAAASTRASDLGLPPVEPATVVHRAMLAGSEAFGCPTGWPDAAATKTTPEERRRLVQFLSEELREPVERMLLEGRRIPEEVVGPVELRSALNSRSPR
jgi:hypothetical protein